MKKHKPLFIVLIAIAVVLIVLVLCLPLPGWPAQKRAIREINRNCNVPFALALPETELQNTDEFIKEEGFGCYDLENDDVTFRLACYPDTLNDFHVISYEIKSSKYTFMGLQVGCSLDAACEAMEQHGYTLSDQYQNVYALTAQDLYRKNGVGITISSSDNTVTSFSVYVKTSNLLFVNY